MRKGEKIGWGGATFGCEEGFCGWPFSQAELAPTEIGMHHIGPMMQSFHVGPVTVPAENNESITAV